MADTLQPNFSLHDLVWAIRDSTIRPESVWIKDGVKAKGGDKHLLSSLAQRCSAKKQPGLKRKFCCDPPLQLIADDMGVDIKTVQRHMTVLKQLGLVKATQKWNGVTYTLDASSIWLDAELVRSARKAEYARAEPDEDEDEDFGVILVSPDDVTPPAAKPAAAPSAPATPAPGVADALHGLTLSAADVTSVAKQLAKHGAILPVLAIARLTPDQLGRLKTAKSPAALLTTILTSEIEKRQASLSPPPTAEVMAAWRSASAEPEVAGLISLAVKRGAEEMCFPRDSDPRFIAEYLDIARKLGDGRVLITGPLWSPDKDHPIIIRAERIDAALIEEEEEDYNPADFADDMPELPDLRCVQAEEFFS